MSTHDNNGREWAKVSEVVAGATVAFDGGFGCLQEDQEYEIKSSGKELYVDCGHGKHTFGVDDMNDERTHYIGVYFISGRGF